MSKYIVYTDGGARGNPGPAGIGAVIKNDKEEVVHEIKKYIGEATNNQAEYWAVIFALEWVLANSKNPARVTHYLDSQLVEQQLKGNYKVKNEALRPLFLRCLELVEKIGNVNFTHVPRRDNKRADALVNEALDKELNK